MGKILTLALFFVCCSTTIAQVYQTEDGLTVTLKKVKNVRDKGDLTSYVKIKDPSVDKILVKCHITSNGNDAVDVNSFALVDKKHKLRYRAVDFINHSGFSSFVSSDKLSKKLLKTPFDKGTSPYEHPLGATYDPEVRDTFTEYSIADFQNVETTMNLGSTRKPHNSLLYYSPTTLNDFTAAFFYAVSREKEAPSFDLYYKGEKLFEIGMP